MSNQSTKRLHWDYKYGQETKLCTIDVFKHDPTATYETLIEWINRLLEEAEPPERVAFDFSGCADYRDDCALIAWCLVGRCEFDVWEDGDGADGDAPFGWWKHETIIWTATLDFDQCRGMENNQNWNKGPLVFYDLELA